MADDSVRLPAAIAPSAYVLRLEPDLTAFTFKGTVAALADLHWEPDNQIALDVKEATPLVIFHASDIKFASLVVEQAGKAAAFGSAGQPPVDLDPSSQTATVDLGAQPAGGLRSLAVGPAVMRVSYTGSLNDQMVGFYRAKYAVGGENRFLATTQFEAIDARRALPCWDEPAAKATFAVTVVVPPPAACGGGGPRIALSNMPIAEQTALPDGATVCCYGITPRMSTYLLAFIVGEFECLEGKAAAGTVVKVWTTPGKREQGRFALDVASRCLDFFTGYFGIGYPLPKADFVAIPDFASGAMENWGLITFRETALLIDEGNSSAATRQRVAYVICHELAHQWFGNLVTMEWWSDLWLNEGFATWVGALGVNALFPEWEYWTQFAADQSGLAMRTDALLSSHPIEVPIRDPKEIQQVFDALSYQKGASVIRLLEAAIGPEPFRVGLNAYLTKHSYGNASTADLWAALAASSGQPVAAMMSAWTSKVGFPVITITEADDVPGTRVLTQSRFLAAGKVSPEQDSTVWYVPLSAAAGSPGSPAPVAVAPAGVLSTKTAPLSLAPALHAAAGRPGGWFKLNGNQTGLYRVNYTPAQWAALGAAVADLSLSPVDRLGLAADALALARCGAVRTSTALGLHAAYAAKEGDYNVMSQVSTALAELEAILSESPCYPAFERYACRLFARVASACGWTAAPGEGHLASMLRSLSLGTLAKYGHKDTVAECKRLFGLLQADAGAVHPDLRGLVMTTAVRHGGESEFESVIAMHAASPLQETQNKCLVAAGSTPHPHLIQTFLAWGLDSGAVRGQDVLYVLAAAAGNPAARTAGWDYVKSHWAALHARFHGAHNMLAYVVSLPIKGFASAAAADDAEAFFKAHPVPEASMALRMALETVRAKASWLQRDGDDIAAYLSEHDTA